MVYDKLHSNTVVLITRYEYSSGRFTCITHYGEEQRLMT